MKRGSYTGERFAYFWAHAKVRPARQGQHNTCRNRFPL